MEALPQIKGKKGNINMLVPAILTLTLSAIILVFGLLILDQIYNQTPAGSEARDAANDTIVGIGTFADYFDLIVLAVIVAIIIGLLLVVFTLRQRQ